MFTWVCPTCGRDLDVSVKECPTCAGLEPPREAVPEPTPPAPSPQQPPKSKPPPSPAAQAFHLSGGQIASFLLLTLVLAAGAVLMARPEIVDSARRLVVPDPGPEIQAGRGENDPIEVAGVRIIKGDGGTRSVRYVLINHSPRRQSGISFEVSLRPLGAPVESESAARFYIALEEPLEPGAVREEEAELRAEPEDVLPPWHDLRVDVRRTSGL